MQNAFRILASRFQVLQTTMQQVPGVVICIVTTCVVMHNLPCQKPDRGQFQPENMGVMLLPYQEKNPTEAAKAQKRVWTNNF